MEKNQFCRRDFIKYSVSSGMAASLAGNKLFADENQIKQMREKYLAGGMGWGRAKQELFEVMNETLSPIREKYYRLIDNKDYIDEILREGAKKAGEIVSKKLTFLRKELGLKEEIREKLSYIIK